MHVRYRVIEIRPRINNQSIGPQNPRDGPPKRFYGGPGRERRMAAKFAVGDRVRINEKTFPSYDEGLFNGLPKAGQVVKAEPESILPYQVAIDTFTHHPFWFYEDQLLFEDVAREAAWAKANAPPVRAKLSPKPEAPTP